MRIEGIAEIIDGHHFERSDEDRSRIVDENVYRPKVLADLVEGSISFFPHGDIAFDSVCALSRPPLGFGIERISLRELLFPLPQVRLGQPRPSQIAWIRFAIPGASASPIRFDRGETPFQPTDGLFAQTSLHLAVE